MLIIAEKPELARAIVEALGGGSKKNGHYICGGDVVTWCFGHMLELYEPEDYDQAYGKWRLEQLPMFFVPWRKKPVAKSKEQLQVILGLLKATNLVVHAGDPDPEGQLLVDEILQYAKYRGQVKRVLINDNTPILVKKALASLRDNAEFAGLSAAAEARQVGDQLFGYNLTRLYTLAARRQGHNAVLSVGRVQTPVLGLVVRRDRENANHQKSFYHAIKGDFAFGCTVFSAAYQVRPDDPTDDKGRLSDKAAAERIAAGLSGKPATVANVATERRETPPPLPYNLLKLQADASRIHGIGPDRVKEVTQTLREKYRLITYNRSDSQYLSDEQHADAPAVIAAVAATVPELTLGCEPLDASRKSRAFNSSKVTAHHAIIPTQARADFSQLSAEEQRIYRLIARAYLAQFLPEAVSEHTAVTLAVSDSVFTASASRMVSPGWKSFYGKEADSGEGDGEPDGGGLAGLRQGAEGVCSACRSCEMATVPKPLYTMASLLEDLTRVAQYVRDDKLRSLLVDKDRGKSGEHGGIGTPATRDVIVATLFERGFLEYSGTGKTRHVVSTAAGREFYDLLPDTVKYPDMTALWHQEQLEIERGGKAIGAFIDGLIAYIGGECARVVADGLGLAVEKHPCPACGEAMLRRKGNKGHFWSCSRYPDCTATLPDMDGKPGTRTDPRERPIPSEIHKCSACGKSLMRRKGKDGYFWGCSGYPECRRVQRDIDGKPDYPARNGKERNKHDSANTGKSRGKRA